MYDSPTLKEIGMRWLAILSWIETYSMLGAIVIGLVAGLFVRDATYLSFGAGLGLVASFFLGFVYSYIFYNLVKCRHCGKRLNHFKNGKKVPSKQAHTQLKAGFGCRHCGWMPRLGVQANVATEP